MNFDYFVTIKRAQARFRFYHVWGRGQKSIEMDKRWRSKANPLKNLIKGTCRSIQNCSLQWKDFIFAPSRAQKNKILAPFIANCVCTKIHSSILHLSPEKDLVDIAPLHLISNQNTAGTLVGKEAWKSLRAKANRVLWKLRRKDTLEVLFSVPRWFGSRRHLGKTFSCKYTRIFHKQQAARRWLICKQIRKAFSNVVFSLRSSWNLVCAFVYEDVLNWDQWRGWQTTRSIKLTSFDKKLFCHVNRRQCRGVNTKFKATGDGLTFSRISPRKLPHIIEFSSSDVYYRFPPDSSRLTRTRRKKKNIVRSRNYHVC